MVKKDKSKITDKNQVQEKSSNIDDINSQKDTEVNYQNEAEQLRNQLAEMNDKYIRLVAEFDNYKKRTLRERMDLIKTAGEDLLKNILPVVDDIERAQTNIENAKDIEAVKTGIDLICNKFMDFLKQQGVQKIEALNKEFDTDHHEAVTKVATPDKQQKGKVIDIIKNGYCLHDKVIRFAQVIVGE